MTPLARTILDILISEAEYPPMSGAKVIECLHYTGLGFGATPAEIEAALDEILSGGQIERIWRRGAAHYRVIQTARPVAADETIRA